MNVTVPMISPADVIAAKRAAGRAVDLADVELLEEADAPADPE